ncbi:target of Sbf [Rhizina undulata]
MPISSNLIVGSIAALSAFSGLASATCNTVINSIPYCNEVDSITYSNIGFTGTYNDVVGMDSDSCTCSWSSTSFSGPMAPLDEELSLHFRGPLTLKQVAVYMPGGSSYKKKRSVENREHLRRHVHHAHHKRDILTDTTTIYTTVTIDQNGATDVPVLSVADVVPTPAGFYSALPTSAGDSGTYGSIVGMGKSKQFQTASSSASSSTSSSASPSASPSSGGSSNFVRSGYYNAQQGVLDGLVFMNHNGGQGSGVFDNCFGNSISYANSQMSGGSSQSEILEDIFIKSDNEFIIFSDQKCSGDDCGYYQPGIPAYHGFGGKSKIFLFEFGMPADTSSAAANSNMPAIWALNAKIPRTAQYGKRSGGDGKDFCSCWESGCGELDLFEVLSGAVDYVTTHYHSEQGTNTQYGGGGSSDYFARPYDGTIKAAVIFDGNNAIHISILPQDTDFGTSLPESLISQASETVSVFNVPS